ncbi:MAG: hypothetical protein ABIA91_01430 [Patescibacteria group bacterium]
MKYTICTNCGFECPGILYTKICPDCGVCLLQEKKKKKVIKGDEGELVNNNLLLELEVFSI